MFPGEKLFHRNHELSVSSRSDVFGRRVETLQYRRHFPFDGSSRCWPDHIKAHHARGSRVCAGNGRASAGFPPRRSGSDPYRCACVALAHLLAPSGSLHAAHSSEKVCVNLCLMASSCMQQGGGEAAGVCGSSAPCRVLRGPAGSRFCIRVMRFSGLEQARYLADVRRRHREPGQVCRTEVSLPLPQSSAVHVHLSSSRLQYSSSRFIRFELRLVSGHVIYGAL